MEGVKGGKKGLEEEDRRRVEGKKRQKNDIITF